MSWSQSVSFHGLEGPAQGLDFPLNAAEVTVGRVRKGPAQAVGWLFLPDETVSGTHAKLRWMEERGSYLLVNHSKTNPTRINGEILPEAVLANGDRLQMGNSLLEVRGVRVGVPDSKGALAPAAAIPPFYLEPLDGRRLALWAPVVALGGSLAASPEPWYGQELSLEEPSLPPLGLQLSWLPQEKAFQLGRRAARDLDVRVERIMDDLEWSARFGAQPALLEAGDVLRIGAGAWKLGLAAECGDGRH